MGARTATSSPFKPLRRLRRVEREMSVGRAAAALPARFVVGLSAVAFTAAAFAAIWTLSTGPAQSVAEAEPVAIESGVRTN